MKKSGKVITFYSFKGGVGRSMALANIACLLAHKQKKEKGQNVLMIDWDLDAPGLHHFFRKFGVSSSKKGLVEANLSRSWGRPLPPELRRCRQPVSLSNVRVHELLGNTSSKNY